MNSKEKTAKPGGMLHTFARLHRTVKASGWVSLVTDFSSDMIYPLLPLFLKSVLGTGAAFIGLVEGAAETTASLLKLWSGYLSDRLGQRKSLVLLGYGISSFARPLMALTTTGWHVLALRLTDRVGKGIRTSPRDALIAACTRPEERGIAFGFQRSMDHAGAFIGPLVAAGLLWWFQDSLHWEQGVSLRWVFALAAIPGLLAPLIIWRYIEDAPPTDSRAPVQAPLTAEGARGLGHEYWKYLAAVLVFTLGNSSDAFLVLRAVDVGVPQWQVPILWAAFHAVKTLCSTPGGRLSDLRGRKPPLFLGWLIYMVSYVLFGLASAPWQIWGIFLFYALFHSCTEGTERAFVADLVPADRRGTAYGWFHAVVGVAALPASLLFGVVWQLTKSPLPPFLMGAGLAGVGAVLLVFVRPARVPRP